MDTGLGANPLESRLKRKASLCTTLTPGEAFTFQSWGALAGLGLALSCSSGEGDADRASGGSSASASGVQSEASTGGAAAQNAGGSSPGDGGAEQGTGASASGGSEADASNTGGGGGDDGAGGSGDDGAGGSGGAAQVLPLSLGMNDVNIFAPLPENLAEPVLLRGSDLADDGTPLIPRELVERLDDDPSTPILTPEAYERLHLVALRFDLCDHHAPGPCPLSGDASMRLVFQPLRENLGAEDVGFHAFYTIAEPEIPAALGALSELSALRSGPAEPLSISVPLSEGKAEYAERVRAFVRAHGGQERLIRLAMNAQPSIFASVTWMFRGVERQGGTFEDVRITGTSESTQQITLVSEGFFQVDPVSDAPVGLSLALDLLAFKDASEDEQRAALEALVAIDNPLVRSTDTLACVACHTSTVSLAMRAQQVGVDPATLAGRFTSSFDVSIAQGMSTTTDRSLRALGWIATTPLISQRVAHDTALVLEDIERRFGQ